MERVSRLSDRNAEPLCLYVRPDHSGEGHLQAVGWHARSRKNRNSQQAQRVFGEATPLCSRIHHQEDY